MSAVVGEAGRLGAPVCFRATLSDFTQDAHGVTSVLEDGVTGERYEVRSRYLIGADGGQSSVAAKAGLPMQGRAGLGAALNVRFDADLSRHVAHRPGSLYWILQPRSEGVLLEAMLRMVRPWNEWVVGFVHLGDSVARLSHAEITGHIREVIQDDSVTIDIRGVHPWRVNHVIAERHSSGRVFCAGDAVHRHPPMNGLGGNTCIQDAFNLAWKLAAVLRGHAGADLLETYGAERRPVGRRVVDRAIASWRQTPDLIRSLGADPADDADVRGERFAGLFAETDEGERRRTAFADARRARDHCYHAHGVEMNQFYESTAVVADDAPPVRFDRDPELFHTPASRPGARLPHCWVTVDGEMCSTLDLARPERFTLLARVRGRAWLEAVEELGAEFGIPLAALRVGPGCEVHDTYGAWADVSEIGESGCLLVRPDQHAAWRCESLPEDPRAELRRVLRRCLSLEDAPAA